MTRETINNEDRGVSLKSVKHILYEVCLHYGNKEIFGKLLERVDELRDWEEYMVIKKQSSGDLISRQDAIKAIDEKAKRIKNEDTLNGLAGAVGILFDLPPVNPQEPKYCDRNICMANEYNKISCDECEVTKSQEPTDENLHREREQAYMQGYEDASKRFRQEPCEDVISRQAVLDLIADYDLSMGQVVRGIHALPSVKPQEKTGHWIWQTEDIYRCSECGEDIRVKEVMNVPQYKVCPMCEARMVEEQEGEEI